MTYIKPDRFVGGFSAHPNATGKFGFGDEVRQGNALAM
jgi:hypothetical protein